MKELDKTEAATIDKNITQPQDQPCQSLSISLETLRAKLKDLSPNRKQP